MALFSSCAFAQSEDWKITTIQTDGDISGHVLHTYSIGIEQAEGKKKIVSGLRFACSVKSSSPVIVSIFWNNPTQNYNPQPIRTTADGVFRFEEDWSVGSTSLYKYLPNSKNLVWLLNSTRIIQFDWADSNGTKYSTAFYTRNFNTNFDNFKELCKIK